MNATQAIKYMSGKDAELAMNVVTGILTNIRGVKIVWHNGSAIDADVHNNIIRIPRVANASMLSQESLMLLRGMVYHEGGHILLTNFPKTEWPQGALMEIWNAVEDRWMERGVRDRFPGARTVLPQMSRHYNAKIAKQVTLEGVYAPLWESLCAMGFMGDGIIPAWRLTPKAQIYFDAGYDTFIKWKGCKSSKDTLAVAKELYELLKEVHESTKQPQPQPQPNQESTDSEDSEEQGQGQGQQQQDEQAEGDSEPQSSDGKDFDDYENEQPEKGESGPGDDSEDSDEEGEKEESEGTGADDSEDDDADEFDEDAESDSEGDDEGDDAEGEGDDESDSEGDSKGDSKGDSEGEGAFDDADDFDEDEAEEEAGENGSNQNAESGNGEYNPVDDSTDGNGEYDDGDWEETAQEELDAKALNESINEDLAEVLADIINDSSIYTARRDNDIHDIPTGDKAVYLNERREVDGKVMSLCRALEQSLRVLSKSRIHSGLRRGTLDNRRLVHAATGISKNVFYKTTNGITMDTVVSIVIDESGSMSNMHEVRRMVIAMGEALTKIGVEFEIVGTTTKYWVGDRQLGNMGGFSRTNPIVYRHYKLFGESWNQVAQRTTAMDASVHNVDGEAVEYASYRLATRKEARKVIFSICDGEPFAGHHNESVMQRNLMDVCKRVRQQGMEVYGFGIGTTEPAKFYGKDNFIYLQNSESMGPEFVKRFASIVTGGMVKIGRTV